MDTDYWYGFNIARAMFSDHGRVASLENEVGDLDQTISSLRGQVQDANFEIMRLQAINRANIRLGQLLMRDLRQFDPYNPLLDEEKRKEMGQEFLKEEYEKLLADRRK